MRSFYGSYIVYHILIGKDGTVLYNRGLNERTGHTSNEWINERSIAIVLAGNFNEEEPTRQQLSSLKREIQRLNYIYQFEYIIPHREASATACPGKHLTHWLEEMYPNKKPPELHFLLSRYYTPVPHQERYYRDYEGSELFDAALKHGVIINREQKYFHSSETAAMTFERMLGKTKQEVLSVIQKDEVLKYMIKRETGYKADFEVNCLGNCLSPADGHGEMKQSMAYKIVACPKEYPFGTKFIIEGVGTTVCRDRGGMIKKEENTVRLDIWAGIGMDGLRKIENSPVPHHPKVTVVLP